MIFERQIISRNLSSTFELHYLLLVTWICILYNSSDGGNYFGSSSWSSPAPLKKKKKQHKKTS